MAEGNVADAAKRVAREWRFLAKRRRQLQRSAMGFAPSAAPPVGLPEAVA